MKRCYSIRMQIAGLVSLLSLFTNEVSAQKWELLKAMPATYAVFVTQSGNLLMSDFLMDFDETGNLVRNGGIYISKDKGDTWEKTDIADYNYDKFYEFGEYVFALGYSGRIARSNDSGETWELINYTYPLKGILDDVALENTACYAMEYHNGKLFVGDYNGGGILYSEDMGETWTMTNLSSLVMPTPGGEIVENIYNLESFNGKLYAFGVYYVFEYVEEYNLWMVIRSDSNFMGQSTVFNGKMYCGRNIMNQTEEAPFLERTADGENWEWVPRPAGQIDNNVRVINHDEHNLYVGLQSRGIYFTENEGESWTEISEGLPTYADDFLDEYISPLQIAIDDEYIYVAMFEDSFSDRNVSGVYRLARADLPTSRVSIQNLSPDPAFKVYADDSYLYINRSGDTTVEVFDVYGEKQFVEVGNGLVDIRSLDAGVYVFKIASEEGKTTGKFLKK